jgi:MerR family transcriptional regulator, light-induced transcriptional regulator
MTQHRSATNWQHLVINGWSDLNRTLLVSAGEAARRLGVSPVTIQRWGDQGLIAVERTAGGHRRIPVSEVLRLLASSRPLPSGPVADWVSTLMSGDSDKVLAALRIRRSGVDRWAAVADEVALAINEIGRAWDVGECTIFEEHLASEGLRRATILSLAEMPALSSGPRVALLTVEDERHTLGLSLSELVFAENGWKTIWIGEGPPLNELDYMIETLKPDVVAVSASASRVPPTLRQYQRALTRLASTGQFRLVLAGAAAWSDAPTAHRILTFDQLDHWIKDSKPHLAEKVGSPSKATAPSWVQETR